MPLDTLIENKTLLHNFPIFSVYVFIPESKHVTEILGEKLSKNVYFIIKEVSVVSLIEASFIKEFIEVGSLYAFSYQAKVEEENFITLLPSGKLILYLQNNIAECLSLRKYYPPELKKHERRTLRFQTCIIDTKLPNFLPGQKLYDSTLNELNKLKDFKFDLLLKWEPTGDICPESIRTYFEKHGYECNTCEPNIYENTKPSVSVPNLNLEELDSIQINDLIHWIGVQLCNISFHPEKSDMLANSSTTYLNEQSKHINFLKIESYEGFFDGDYILSILKESREVFKKYSNLPFIIVSIAGYLESYFELEKKFRSGDKSIFLVISPQLQCWIITYKK
ncbi:uncharacterized protein CDAR_33811 [Caerostris darwini]|uniref:Uncharacterized protein n=1 Tax=Caerostris darwini TaxID=1538125 RepID=A0AAV4UNU2_9ARAC|nr:uncharacterized protein CDAR_33811 [Caerostris darwini]